MKLKQTFSIIVILFTIFAGFPDFVQAQLNFNPVRTIIFPVIGKVSYYDDFGNPRVGHTHEGNDLMGKKLMPLVAAVDGTISLVNYPEKDWGYSVTIRDSEGYRYNYLHMNNDNSGTDDGKGDGMNAYAPDIEVGNKVVKGQLIGYMGDSGNAEGTTAHLHFEIRTPSGEAFSPYQSLQNATKIITPVTTYPAQQNEILPYGDFGGGTNIATGNIDSDSDLEIVTGAAKGGGPLVKVLEKDGTIKNAWYAYSDTFRGGVDVATGDIDKDGKVEIITAAGSGGGPHIKIFKSDGVLLKEFLAYDGRFRGGVFISSTDWDNDGVADIITGPGAGGGPHVKVFSGSNLGVIKEFLAYDSKFYGGIDVAGITKVGSGFAGIVTAPQAGGGPHIKIFDSNVFVVKEFFAYDGMFNLGARISVGNFGSNNSGLRLAVVPATGGGPHLKTFSISDGSLQTSSLAGFEAWWRGGYDVAFIDNRVLMSSIGGRRASVRLVNPSGSSNNNFGNNSGNNSGNSNSSNNSGNGFPFFNFSN